MSRLDHLAGLVFSAALLVAACSAPAGSRPASPGGQTPRSTELAQADTPVPSPTMEKVEATVVANPTLGTPTTTALAARPETTPATSEPAKTVAVVAPTGAEAAPQETAVAQVEAGSEQTTPQAAADMQPGPSPEQQQLLADLQNHGPAPELHNEAWLNSEPLKLADLRGKVVLVEFWTFG